MSDLHKMLIGITVEGTCGPINLYNHFGYIKDRAQTWLSKLSKNGYQHSCVFRRIPATCSDPFRPGIPIDSGHLFRSIPATPLGENKSDAG